MRTLLVLGGTGVVGKRIARLARARFDRVLVGSRSARGDGAVQVDASDRASLARALEGVEVAVNAIGPFEYDPRTIVEACVEAGCQYVDIAETESFLDAVRAVASKQDRIGAVSGASTVPGLVEVLARALPSGLERVRAYLSVGTGNEASSTLIASMLAPIGRSIPGGARAFDELVRVDHAGLGERVYGRYPSGADASGIVLSSSSARVPLELYFGCDRALYARALGAASGVLGRSRRLASIAARAAMPLVPVVRALGTDVGVLRVEGVGAGGAVRGAVEVRARRDGLDVPALPAVWAAEALRDRRGALRLAELIEAREAVERLEAAGFEVRMDPPAPVKDSARDAWNR